VAWHFRKYLFSSPQTDTKSFSWVTVAISKQKRMSKPIYE